MYTSILRACDAHNIVHFVNIEFDILSAFKMNKYRLDTNINVCSVARRATSRIGARG